MALIESAKGVLGSLVVKCLQGERKVDGRVGGRMNTWMSGRLDDWMLERVRGCV